MCSQRNDSWNEDLSPLSEGFLDEPQCEFYHRRQGHEMTQNVFVFLKYIDGFGPPVTEGKGKSKVHPCTGTEALYRPYGP